MLLLPDQLGLAAKAAGRAGRLQDADERSRKLTTSRITAKDFGDTYLIPLLEPRLYVVTFSSFSALSIQVAKY